MQTCETCRHWGARLGEATGECQAANDDAPADDRTAFAVRTRSDETAYLLTGADFGCVCHEPPRLT